MITINKLFFVTDEGPIRSKRYQTLLSVSADCTNLFIFRFIVFLFYFSPTDDKIQCYIQLIRSFTRASVQVLAREHWCYHTGKHDSDSLTTQGQTTIYGDNSSLDPGNHTKVFTTASQRDCRMRRIDDRFMYMI